MAGPMAAHESLRPDHLGQLIGVATGRGQHMGFQQLGHFQFDEFPFGRPQILRRRLARLLVALFFAHRTPRRFVVPGFI